MHMWVFGMILEESKNDEKKGLQQPLRVIRSGGTIITTGLRVSWVLLSLGPWSLERGKRGLAGDWPRLVLEAQAFDAPNAPHGAPR